MFKKQNGITLVALVVTIIVLIILAGVTLMIALDNDGIISKTQEGAEQYNEAQEGAEQYNEAQENENAQLERVNEYLHNEANF